MSDFAAFLETALGRPPSDLTLFERAATHASFARDSYDRLEFLGDRVLGLVIARLLFERFPDEPEGQLSKRLNALVSRETCAEVGRALGDRVLGLVIARLLFERFPDEPEGQLSKRLNALVSRETCAEVGRALGVPGHIRLGKQAREDRAADSENVVGDVVESLIGALFIDSGLEAAEAFIRRSWAPYVENQQWAPQHPKSALQELAADLSLAPPHYELVSRTGAHHAPTFRIRVSIKGGGEAEAEGPSKQDAEKAAAAALLEKLR